MPTAIDVFEKVRGHERAEQLRAAREADLLPYFRRLESPAAPVVEMEGAERVMLGSNNYLGLTGDERVIAGARDALGLKHPGIADRRACQSASIATLSSSRGASSASTWSARSSMRARRAG